MSWGRRKWTISSILAGLQFAALHHFILKLSQVCTVLKRDWGREGEILGLYDNDKEDIQ